MGSFHSIWQLVAREGTDAAVFLPVLAPCLRCWEGRDGGHELGAEDNGELAVAGPPDALMLDSGKLPPVFFLAQTNRMETFPSILLSNTTAVAEKSCRLNPTLSPSFTWI